MYLEKEMATRPSVLAWRIPGMVEHDGLSSMGSNRVGHNWGDLAAAAAAIPNINLILSPRSYESGMYSGEFYISEYVYKCSVSFKPIKYSSFTS